MNEAEDENAFIKYIKELYFKCYGINLPTWQEVYMTTLYRFHKQHPNAKILYGRDGLKIVMPKEESNDDRKI